MSYYDNGVMKRAERVHGSPFPSVYDGDYTKNTPAEEQAARCVITQHCDQDEAAEILGMLGLPS